jgi:hypothetical protein
METRRDPDLIKVDVEGNERRVLEGAASLIERSRPTWVIEIHPPQLRECGRPTRNVSPCCATRAILVEVLERKTNSLYTILARHRSTGI